MVNVLIVGATGYIGQALSSSLLRSGTHRVYGLARTSSKATILASQEIIPIIGDASSSQILLDTITQQRIDIIIDVSGANQESRTLLAIIKQAGQTRLSLAEQSGFPIPKLGFIYVSGTWVHGSSHLPVSDLTPVGTSISPTPPVTLTEWRPSLEREIIASSDVLDVMIVRPALVYGRSSAIWTSLFTPLISASTMSPPPASISIPVEADTRSGLVHVDDVASGLHAAVDKLPGIAGTGIFPVFDLVSSQESMRDILEAVAREVGLRGKVILAGAGEDLFMKALSTSLNGCSGRAKTILGWEPKKVGFVKGMDVFVKAFLASKE